MKAKLRFRLIDHSKNKLPHSFKEELSFQLINIICKYIKARKSILDKDLSICFKNFSVENVELFNHKLHDDYIELLDSEIEIIINIKKQRKDIPNIENLFFGKAFRFRDLNKRAFLTISRASVLQQDDTVNSKSQLDQPFLWR